MNVESANDLHRNGITPESLTTLAELLYDEDDNDLLPGPLPMDFTKQVAMTCLYLGSKEINQRQVFLRLAHTFGVCEATFLAITHKIIKRLCAKVDTLITWPKKEEYHQFEIEFNPPGRKVFPGVIGALDGCHVMIEPFKDEIFSCWNYKDYHSINLMAVVGPRRQFMDIYVGFPGRAHDQRVYRNAPLSDLLAQRMSIPGCNLQNSYHIVGDAAFTCTKDLMVPFKKTQGILTAAQKKFNSILSSKRIVVEHAFGILLGRWLRLKYLNMKTMEKRVQVVVAACVLHNFCIAVNDTDLSVLDMEPVEEILLTTNGRPLYPGNTQDAGNLKHELLKQIIDNMY